MWTVQLTRMHSTNLKRGIGEWLLYHIDFVEWCLWSASFLPSPPFNHVCFVIGYHCLYLVCESVFYMEIKADGLKRGHISSLLGLKITPTEHLGSVVFVKKSGTDKNCRSAVKTHPRPDLIMTFLQTLTAPTFCIYTLINNGAHKSCSWPLKMLRFCVLVIISVPNILQCRECKLRGPSLTPTPQNKRKNWDGSGVDLCYFSITSSQMYIVFTILFCIESYASEKKSKPWVMHEKKWVLNDNQWWSWEN